MLTRWAYMVQDVTIAERLQQVIVAQGGSDGGRKQGSGLFVPLETRNPAVHLGIYLHLEPCRGGRVVGCRWAWIAGV